MRYPIEKYQIVVHQHPDYHTTEILARSTYAGETVKGKAICHLNDTYDEDKGVKLAVARCAEKIAKKRKARATKKLAEAEEILAMAQAHYDDMVDYLANSTDALIEAENHIDEVLKNM